MSAHCSIANARAKVTGTFYCTYQQLQLFNLSFARGGCFSLCVGPFWKDDPLTDKLRCFRCLIRRTKRHIFAFLLWVTIVYPCFYWATIYPGNFPAETIGTGMDGKRSFCDYRTGGQSWNIDDLRRMIIFLFSSDFLLISIHFFAQKSN